MKVHDIPVKMLALMVMAAILPAVIYGQAILSCRFVSSDGMTVQGTPVIKLGIHPVMNEVHFDPTPDSSGNEVFTGVPIDDSLYLTFVTTVNGYIGKITRTILVHGDSSFIFTVDTIPGAKRDLRIHLKHDIYPPAPPASGVPIHVEIDYPYVYDTMATSDSAGIVMLAHIPSGNNYLFYSSSTAVPYLPTDGMILFRDTQDVDITLIPDTATFGVDGRVIKRTWVYNPPQIDTIITGPCANCPAKVGSGQIWAHGATDSASMLSITGLRLSSFNPDVELAVLPLAKDSLTGWYSTDTGDAYLHGGFRYNSYAKKQLNLRAGLHGVVFSGQPRFLPRDTAVAGSIRLTGATEKLAYPRANAMAIRVWITNIPSGENPSTYTANITACSNEASLVSAWLSDGQTGRYEYHSSPYLYAFDYYRDSLWPCIPPASDLPAIPPGTMAILTGNFQTSTLPYIQYQTVMHVTVSIPGIEGASVTLPIRISTLPSAALTRMPNASHAPKVRLIPTRRIMDITGMTTGHLDIQIMDLAGRVVCSRRQTVAVAGTLRISLPDAGSGLYIVKVQSDYGWSLTQKVMMP